MSTEPTASSAQFYIAADVLPVLEKGERPVAWVWDMAPAAHFVFHATRRADAFALPASEAFYPVPVVRAPKEAIDLAWAWFRRSRPTELFDRKFLLVVEPPAESGSEARVTAWWEPGVFSRSLQEIPVGVLGEAAMAMARMKMNPQWRSDLDDAVLESESRSDAAIEQQNSLEQKIIESLTPARIAEAKALQKAALGLAVRSALDDLLARDSSDLPAGLQGAREALREYWPERFAVTGWEKSSHGGAMVSGIFPDKLDRTFTFWIYDTGYGGTEVGSIETRSLSPEEIVEWKSLIDGESAI